MRLPLQRAWSGVQIEIRHPSGEVEYCTTPGDLTCKLQFVLSDDKLKKNLLHRLKRQNMTVKVQENKESFVVELQKQMKVDNVKDAFEHALEDQILKEIKFENEQKLNSSLDRLDEVSKEFLYSGTVGLFLDTSEDDVILKMVGPKVDVDYLENILRVEDKKKLLESSCFGTELNRITLDKKRNVYVAHCVFDEDTIQYLHVLNFPEQLSKKCTNVNYVEIDNNGTEFFIEGSEKQNVKGATDYLMKFVSTAVRKSVSVSSAALTFIQAQSIVLYCKEILKQVPAHLQVSNKIVIWAPSEKHFERAKNKLFDCFVREVVKLNVEITGEVRKTIDNSDGKIQLLEIPDTNDENKVEYHVVYLRDASDEAQKVIACLKSDVKPSLVERSAQFEEHVIRYAVASRLEEDLNEAFPLVKIDYSIENRSMIIIAETKSEAEDALKEFIASVRKVEKVEIRELSEGVKELLVRGHIGHYVSKQLKKDYLLFMAEGEKFVCIGQKIGDGSKLKENIEKNCIMSTSFVKVFHQMDIGKEFMERFADKIVVEETNNKNVSCIYYTKDIQEEVHSFVEKCSMSNYYKKKCNPATSEFLQIPNLSIVSKVEKDFDVKLGFENGYILFRGNYENGEKASKELEKNIPHDFLILNNGERFKSLLESEEGKEALTKIAREKNCSWSMTCQLEGRAEKLDKVMMTGK